MCVMTSSPFKFDIKKVKNLTEDPKYICICCARTANEQSKQNQINSDSDQSIEIRHKKRQKLEKEEQKGEKIRTIKNRHPPNFKKLLFKGRNDWML